MDLLTFSLRVNQREVLIITESLDKMGELYQSTFFLGEIY